MERRRVATIQANNAYETGLDNGWAAGNDINARINASRIDHTDMSRYWGSASLGDDFVKVVHKGVEYGLDVVLLAAGGGIGALGSKLVMHGLKTGFRSGFIYGAKSVGGVSKGATALVSGFGTVYAGVSTMYDAVEGLHTGKSATTKYFKSTVDAIDLGGEIYDMAKSAGDIRVTIGAEKDGVADAKGTVGMHDYGTQGKSKMLEKTNVEMATMLSSMHSRDVLPKSLNSKEHFKTNISVRYVRSWEDGAEFSPQTILEFDSKYEPQGKLLKTDIKYKVTPGFRYNYTTDSLSASTNIKLNYGKTSIMGWKPYIGIELRAKIGE